MTAASKTAITKVGNNVLVESELQDDYSVKDADEGFDDDLDEDSEPVPMTWPRSRWTIPSTMNNVLLYRVSYLN